MIKPTVGRVVWYTPCPDDSFPTIAGQPLAAIIAAVWDDTRVNLLVIDANGITHNLKSVLLVQEDAERPVTGFCEWMPYQKAVASGQIAPTVHAQPK